MIFMQLNPPGAAGCSTYLVGSSGEGIIVDPLREHLDHYLAVLDQQGIRLVVVADTHTHADHASGAPELARRTGATLVMHHQAPRACVSRRVRHGDELVIGSLRAKVLATPGHTYDSFSLLFPDRILTGDLLDVGPRGHAGETCSDPAAARESMERLRALDPTLLVYGTHPPQGPQRVLLTALAEASRSIPSTTGEQPRSWAAGEFTVPDDPALLEVLRENLACVPAARGSEAPMRVDPPHPKRITPADLAQALRSSKPPFVVDVRSPDEYFSQPLGRVPDSLLVPLEHLEAELANLRGLEGPLVVTCRTTARALLGASLLQQHGLQHVQVLEGGVIAWRADGHPVELDGVHAGG